MIDHDLLLIKMEHYGIRGATLSLIRSYLRNRKQIVEIRNVINKKEIVTKSRAVTIRRGVPQGSILGPVFFVIFLNDITNYLTEMIPDVGLVIYADDTNAIIPADNLQDLSTSVNRTIAVFNDWFQANKLKVNVSKTNALLFKTTSRQSDTLDIQFKEEKVELSKCVKFLGVQIDELLNWKDELESITNSVSSACYAIRSLRDVLTIDQIRMVYFALVESKLRYSIKFWGGSYKYNINRAFCIQKRAIRTIVRIPQWESCRAFFKSLNILTVPSLYILITLVDVMKHPHRFETVEQKQQRIATRRKDLHFPYQPTLNIAKHSCRYQAVVLFNALPAELKNTKNLNLFKNKLKEILLKGCYYSVEDFLSDDISMK